MYNQHTIGLETTRHRSLVERGGRETFVRDKDLAQKKEKKERKKMSGKKFTNLKKRIRAHRASSKATGLFLTK